MAGISITLGGNFAKLDELKSKARTAAASVKSSFAGVGKALSLGGVGLSAGAAFAGIGLAMKTAIDAGGELSDMMARTGAGGRDLVILQQMFANAGVEASKVPVSLNKMQKALAGVNEDGEQTANAFNKIGLNIHDLQKMDAVGAFRAIGEKIAGIESPAQRTAAAMEIFGKSGGELLAVMTDGSAWQSARDQVGTYGDKLAESAERFDQIGDSVALLQNAFKSFGVSIANQVAPALEWAAEAMEAFNSGVNIFSGSGLDLSDRARAPEQAAQWAKDDPGYMRSAKEDAQGAMERANTAYWAGLEAEKQETSAKAADKKREAEEKAAEAAAKKAEAEAKTKAIAADEYKLEAAILQARLTGDDERLAKLEREKAIRAEMAKLTGAGWDAATAREQSGKMVDARAAADRADKNRQDGMQSNASSLGAFAQSMNVLFGRSANSGLLEENKRQTKLLSDIQKGLQKGPPPVKLEIVPTF
jgi:hypothetical protein